MILPLDSAVTNLTEFFERFRTLNVRSSEQLDELVPQAQQVIGGVEPQQLRDSESLRQRLVTQLAGVQSSLDGLLVDRPRRNILRRPQYPRSLFTHGTTHQTDRRHSLCVRRGCEPSSAGPIVDPARFTRRTHSRRSMDSGSVTRERPRFGAVHIPG